MISAKTRPVKKNGVRLRIRLQKLEPSELPTDGLRNIKSAALAHLDDLGLLWKNEPPTLRCGSSVAHFVDYATRQRRASELTIKSEAVGSLNFL